jgi:hypothetical protein
LEHTVAGGEALEHHVDTCGQKTGPGVPRLTSFRDHLATLPVVRSRLVRVVCPRSDDYVRKRTMCGTIS